MYKSIILREIRNSYMVLNENNTAKLSLNKDILINRLKNYRIGHKIVEWPYGLDNAQIVITNFFPFTNIF